MSIFLFTEWPLARGLHSLPDIVANGVLSVAPVVTLTVTLTAHLPGCPGLVVMLWFADSGSAR
jgi:hypothetical protein